MTADQTPRRVPTYAERIAAAKADGSAPIAATAEGAPTRDCESTCIEAAAEALAKAEGSTAFSPQLLDTPDRMASRNTWRGLARVAVEAAKPLLEAPLRAELERVTADRDFARAEAKSIYGTLKTIERERDEARRICGEAGIELDRVIKARDEVTADRDRLAAACALIDRELTPHSHRAGMSPGHEAIAQALAATEWPGYRQGEAQELADPFEHPTGAPCSDPWCEDKAADAPSDLAQARAELKRVTDERDAMVNAFARAVSLPPEQVAKAHSVRFTGTPPQPPIASPAAVLGSSSRAQEPAYADLIEELSRAAHNAWMDTKLAQGITSRLAEWGEELMVPYADLSERARDLDRGTVRGVLVAVERAGYVVTRDDPWAAASAPTVGDAPAGAQETAQRAAMDGAAHSVWLHGKWRWLTKNMTTEEREAFADAVERYSARLEPEDPATVDRWWRDTAAVDALGESSADD